MPHISQSSGNPDEVGASDIAHTTDANDSTAMQDLACTEFRQLQAAIRRHPELNDPEGCSFLAVVAGLLSDVALVGPYDDLLQPLQTALDAVG